MHAQDFYPKHACVQEKEAWIKKQAQHFSSILQAHKRASLSLKKRSKAIPSRISKNSILTNNLDAALNQTAAASEA